MTNIVAKIVRIFKVKPDVTEVTLRYRDENKKKEPSWDETYKFYTSETIKLDKVKEVARANLIRNLKVKPNPTLEIEAEKDKEFIISI